MRRIVKFFDGILLDLILALMFLWAYVIERPFSDERKRKEISKAFNFWIEKQIGKGWFR